MVSLPHNDRQEGVLSNGAQRMDKNAILSKIKHGLIVSCQAEGNEPLNTPDILTAIAKAAVNGGAVAIRAEDPKNIEMMKQALDVPIIGLYKVHYPNSEVYITPTINDALAVQQAGADVIAMDATIRERPNGVHIRELIDQLRKRGDALLMADVSTLEEGLMAYELGFDMIGTTLAGYTAYTKERAVKNSPDLELLNDLSRHLKGKIPIIAEGRIWTPQQAVIAFENGAFAVVVGTAITRPTVVTRLISEEINTYHHRKERLAVGIDLGGTKTAIGLISYDGSIHEKQFLATPWELGMANLVRTLSDQILNMIDRKSYEIDSVGIAATGRVDIHQGIVFDGVPIIKDYLGFPLTTTLSSYLQMPVLIENDVNAAALAEYRVLKSKPERFVLITIGTGIGGGIIIDGNLIRGTGHAGEIGHICVDKDGDTCPCGRRGCLENYVSRKKLGEEIAHNLYSRGIVKRGNTLSLTTEQIISYIRSGDPEIWGLFQRQMDYLACGIESIIQTIEPDMIVFGGEMSRMGNLFLAEIENRIHTTVRMGVASLGNDAGMIGAAKLAIEQAEVHR
ncbi:putative N-acetylmannosamine-6-phosphate 2-epimerase [candidate division KSB1 bacterium]|nr:putative N-acetylmannosamine-6-phosphate 2-epimerase [candidate division KSB1 bacterium]